MDGVKATDFSRELAGGMLARAPVIGNRIGEK